MKDELNINNSKKLIIGISILFCTVILIIGATTAFFTEGDTKETGNIVSTDQVSLLFDDNNDYMFGNLIPVSEEDVLKFASKDTDICKYQEAMYACNLYEFTITNNSNVSQELIITLNPTFNEFGNLHYVLLDKNKDDISLDNVPVSNGHINGTNSTEIANKVVLGTGSSKTYTLVYYVKNLEDIDQTEQDAGKQFYAKVRVDSITTGTYAETLMESRCYEYEEITDGEYTGTYKLTKFNGINHDTGVADTTCGVAQNGDFYSVIVPSKLKDEEGNELEISTLGNKLFAAVIIENENMIMNPYYTKINNIDIENGIKEFEDGIYNEGVNMCGTFVGIGKNIENGEVVSNPIITLPNTLNKIGKLSFAMIALENIIIPKSVEIINDMAFYNSATLSNITFEVDSEGISNLKTIGEAAFEFTSLEEVEIPYSVTYIEDDAFKVETLEKVTFLGDLEDTTNQLAIGNYAFDANLNYTTKENPLIIPARVTSIGDGAFGNSQYNSNLKFIKYMGSSTALSNLGTNWYKTNVVEYIKSKDEYVVN